MPSSVMRHISNRFTFLEVCAREVSGGFREHHRERKGHHGHHGHHSSKTHATTKSSTSGDSNLIRNACRMLVGRCTVAMYDMLL